VTEEVLGIVYCVSALKQHCADYLLRSISRESVVGVEKVAKAFNETALATSSATFLSLNKDAIVKQPEFNEFDRTEVQSLIFSDEKRVSTCFIFCVAEGPVV